MAFAAWPPDWGWVLGCGEEPQHRGNCTGTRLLLLISYELFFLYVILFLTPSLQWFVVSLLWLKSGARHMASYVKMPARMGWRDKLGQTCTYCNCLSSLIQAVQETKVVLGEPGQWKCEHTFIYSCQRCVWLQDCGPATSHCTWHPPSMGSAASFLGDFHTCPDFTNSITADCACS